MQTAQFREALHLDTTVLNSDLGIFERVKMKHETGLDVFKTCPSRNVVDL